MAYANVPFRLVSRSALNKADVESVYGELVKVIGGTYYLNGVAQGPVNGSLDWRNFAPDAGITNANKAAPYSVFSVTVGSMNNPSGVPPASLSFEAPITSSVYTQGDQLPPSLTVIGYTFAWNSISNAVNSGSATFQRLQIGGASTNFGPAITWTNAPTTPFTQTTSGISVPINPGDSLNMVVVMNGAFPTNFFGTFWCKALHIK